MAVEFTFDDEPNRTYNLDLDGTIYQLTMRYSGVDDSWYMDLADAQGATLLTGVTVTINNLVLDRFRRVGFPEGDFVFLLTAKKRDPRRDDISELKLIYLKESEVG